MTKLSGATCATRLPGRRAFSRVRHSTHPPRCAPFFPAPVTYSSRQGAQIRSIRPRSAPSDLEVHLVHGETRPHALELRVPGVSYQQPPADLLVEVLHHAAALGVGLHQGQVGLE